MQDKYKDFDSIGFYTVPSTDELEYDFRKADDYAKSIGIDPKNLTIEDWEKFRIKSLKAH